MKLYFSPAACSLSPHIVLREGGFDFTTEKVDLNAHRTASGASLTSITAKDYVPVLELDNGERLTEGPAIVQYIADLKPDAGLIPKAGTFERYRVQEWLNFITSELHKTFSPLFRETTSKDWRDASVQKITDRLQLVDNALAGKQYLVGDRFSVADAYLFTVINWAPMVGIDLKRWPALAAFHARIASRPKVQEAFKAEGVPLRAAA